jgi:NAD(P)-dependent dehydrogenase (short-subunit alcohol dehydrogenase family)
MLKRLAGKTAAVLGASQRGGSGWVTAQMLAAEGAHVFVAARRLEKVQELAAEIGGTALRCDACDEAQVAAFAEAAAAHGGRIDLAVAAVGQGAVGSIDETDQDRLHEAFAVNFFGPFQFVRYAARHMERGGSVTLFSSITSTDVLPGAVAYSCAKGALNTFVRYAAIEYADRGIRVNALKLGILEGPQARRWRKAGMFAPFMREVPLGAPVDPAEIARMIIWLATDAKSITGECIYVDGGSHLRRQPFPDEMSEDALQSMGKRPTLPIVP